MRSPTHPIRICVVIKGLGLGGAERLWTDALRYLDRRTRFAYHFSYVTPWKDALAPRFVEAGVPVTCLGGAPPASSSADQAAEAICLELLGGLP